MRWDENAVRAEASRARASRRDRRSQSHPVRHPCAPEGRSNECDGMRTQFEPRRVAPARVAETGEANPTLSAILALPLGGAMIAMG